MSCLSKIPVIFLLASFFPLSVSAHDPLDVIINEIAWTGTEASYNDEWIELYNNTDSKINLSGWTLTAKDDIPKINLTGEIPAKGFYLLERTNEETVPGVFADQIYSGALGNSGENLILFDVSGNPIDSVNCAAAWFAGDNTAKQTMERKDSQFLGDNAANWQNSKNPEGTPKTINSQQAIINNGEEPIPENPEKEENDLLPPTEEPNKSYASGILINELLPSPEGPDGEGEWIEIFNQNDFIVDLSDWWITDEAGKVAVYILPEETNILPKGFLIFSRKTTKIILNNDGDAVDLAYPDGFLADSVGYKKSPLGQSYNRINSTDWEWSASLTPGKKNIFSAPEKELLGTEGSPDNKNNPKGGNPSAENYIKNSGENSSLNISAQISSSLRDVFSSKSFFVFLTALTVSVFSALIILSAKNRLTKIEKSIK